MTTWRRRPQRTDDAGESMEAASAGENIMRPLNERTGTWRERVSGRPIDDAYTRGAGDRTGAGAGERAATAPDSKVCVCFPADDGSGATASVDLAGVVVGTPGSLLQIRPSGCRVVVYILWCERARGSGVELPIAQTPPET